MKLLFSFLLAASMLFGTGQDGDTLYVATWNIENLFDTADDPDKRDEDFTPEGKKNWDEEKLRLKLDNLSKVITFMNDGNGPDILGMQEVENEGVARELVKKLDEKYELVYSESPDGRGIDNCLIYNKTKLDFVSMEAITVKLPDDWPTRDIILVKLANHYGDTIAVFVNHWPSRSGGQEKSEPNRIAAGSTLKQFLVEKNFCTSGYYTIMLGDFNDEPDNISIAEKLGAKPFSCDVEGDGCELFNLAFKMAADSLGTYLYKGDWNMLDQIIVSENVVKDDSFIYICNSFNILKPPFMITADGFYKGSAIPTFGGKNYLKGYSDHYPVYARFLMKGK